MDADESRRAVRRPRRVERVELPAGPARDLRDAIYLLYGQADAPALEELAKTIADDESLPGAPKKDTINRIISGAGLAAQQDTVSVAVALARAGEATALAIIAGNVRRLWEAAWLAPTPPASARLGQLIKECDPLVLEVHPAIDVPDAARSGGQLPAYVVRAHDLRLRAVVDQ